MHSQGRGLTIATAMLVLAGYTALSTVDSIGNTALIAPVVMLLVAPLGVWADGRFSWYRHLSGTVSVLVLLTLPLFVLAWGLLDSVTFLLVYIQAYELAHRKEIRNYYHIYLMAFFLLLSACAREPSAGISVVIGLFLLSAVWAFFILQIAAATKGSRRHVAPDIVPLHSEAALTLPPGPNAMRNGVILSATMMSIASVMLTVVLFMATPRMEAGVFGRNQDQASRVQDIGLSQNIDLSGGHILVNRGTPAMRVEFPDEPDGLYDGALYWRSHALNQYSRRSFDIAELPARGRLGATAATRLQTRNLRDGRVIRTAWDEENRMVRQQIVLTAPSSHFPVLETPVEVESESHRFEWSTISPGDITVNRSYRYTVYADAVSEIREFSPDELRQAPTDYSDRLHQRNRGFLTRQDLQSRTRDLVDEIVAGTDNPYDACVAIEAFFAGNQFVYSLDVPALPNDNPIDYFIWETQRGHCQLYASAMALMVRYLDIPARVVNGYRGGAWDPDEKAYFVSTDMAHTWVEVYFLDHGWVRFDPAPSISDVEDQDIGILQMLQRWSLDGRIFWYQNVVGYQGGFQLSEIANLNFGQIFGSIFNDDAGPSQGEATAESVVPSRSSIVLWTTILFIGTALLIWSMRNRPKRSGVLVSLTPDQRRAQKLFLQLRQSMNARGVDVSNMSAHDLLVHARQDPNLHENDLDEIIEAYNLVRFGMRPMENNRFREFLQMIKDLRARA